MGGGYLRPLRHPEDRGPRQPPTLRRASGEPVGSPAGEQSPHGPHGEGSAIAPSEPLDRYRRREPVPPFHAGPSGGGASGGGLGERPGGICRPRSRRHRGRTGNRHAGGAGFSGNVGVLDSGWWEAEWAPGPASRGRLADPNAPPDRGGGKDRGG